MQYRFVDTGKTGKARCEPGWQWRPPALPDFDLWYPLSGQGEMKLNGSVYPIRRGSCFLVRPGDRPEAEQHPTDRLTVIFSHFRIDGDIGERIPDRCTRVDEPYLFERLLEKLIELHDADRGQAEPGTAEQFDAVMRVLWLELIRQREQAQLYGNRALKQLQLVERLKRYIRDRTNARVSHRELADLVGLSPEYANILFKKYTGSSIKQYITDARLERAAYLLTETTMNVSQAAEALGYANVYLFSKQFKEKFGVPPSRYQWKGTAASPHPR